MSNPPRKKPITPEQRAAHNARDRERRAEKKEKKALDQKPISEKRRIRAQLVAAKIIENPSLSVSAAARAVGLPENIAAHPATITQTVEWNELLDQMLPQGDLLVAHKGLLRASRIDHLVFTRDGEPNDEEIALMLMEVNCKVRKIVHGEQARHVYFFAPDNKARSNALEMAYKLRGSFAADKAAVAFSLAALATARDQRTEIAASRDPQLPESI